MFSALLYSSEAWGDLSRIADSLLVIERKAIKSCLGVKQGTSNNIIYAELNRPDIISIITQRQHNFFEKFSSIIDDDAVAKQIWTKYTNLYENGRRKSFVDYYTSLQGNATKNNISQRKLKLSQSTKSMDVRYTQLFGLEFNQVLYKDMSNDIDRKIITRWRLSSHSLYIETGRYKRPEVKRDDRKCLICDILEDETHALLNCKAHYLIRAKYQGLLIQYTSVNKLLNPTDIEDAKLLACYLRDIEENMKTFKMIR